MPPPCAPMAWSSEIIKCNLFRLLSNPIAKFGGRFHLSSRSMKFWGLFLAAVAFCSGCASGDKELDAVTRITPAEPPSFLNADVAGLFGKANFTARVSIQKGVPGTRPPLVGELSGRNGNLFFIADEERRKGETVGGLSVLWHAPTTTAYLLDEALQGYAPIRSVSTNGPLEVTVIGEENVGGAPARLSVLQRVVGAQMVPVLVVWRGIAQQDLPVKIQMTNSPGAVTLSLSRIRFEAPPAELFALPNGFRKYESTDAMTSELVKRRTDLLSARSKRHREKYGLPAGDDDQEEVGTSRSVDRPIRPY